MSLHTQFLLVASAHFLALLSPGPDFFLILRSALRHGFRMASGVCAGIAFANGIFIAFAVMGVSLLSAYPLIFVILKWAGCLYLAWLGWVFLRAPFATSWQAKISNQVGRATLWWQEFGAGFLSGILNPKNSLFYVSLFTLVIQHDTPLIIQSGYGLWMFAIVLLWDLCVAWAVGHPRVMARLERHLRGLEKLTGVALFTVAASIALATR
ncbi:LysE family translocator [Uliginosibacterium gangwonense]|uniref:LysE family translocator n=1 Tax=Uliginosibacterium gangwonense TaxID=392736 RepID=UPI00037EAA45|nr:LysE family translocator [Uliginosibacterium gangwonense]